MKGLPKLLVALACAIIFFQQGFAQKLNFTETTLPISKEAQKKGMYVNTTITDKGSVKTFIAYDLKKGELGFDVVAVDLNGKLIENVSEIANAETTKKHGISVPSPSTLKNPAGGLTILRLVTANGVLGKLKIEEGTFEPRYATDVDYGGNIVTYTRVLRGFKFESKKSIESDMRLNVFAAHILPEYNVERSYTIIEGMVPSTVAYVDKGGSAAFLGKDPRVDKDSENAQNVFVTGIFDGKTSTFTNIKQHVIDYNLIDVTAGFSGNGDRAVLMSTLNAPTTLAKHKKFQADGKPLMTYATFDFKGNLTQNITFESGSVRGGFAIFGFDEGDFILGNVNGDHNGYYRWDVGSPTHFQIIKIANGQLAGKEWISLDQMEKILVVAEGKGKLNYKDITFTHCQKTTNGDFLATAISDKGYFIFQFDAIPKMKAVYYVPRVPGKELSPAGSLTLEAGGSVYFLFREQDAAISLGVKKSYSRNSGTYAKDINVSRVDEFMTYGSLVKIDPANKTCTEPLNFNDDLILGEDPLFLSENGGLLITPLRDSKKNYKAIYINP